MRWVYNTKINPDHELLKYGEILAQILFTRGIESIEEAEEFFNKDLKLIPAFSLIPNIKKAGALVKKVIDSKSKIYIYGDYDVDGISSSAILFDFVFRDLKADVIPYIPNRFEEGYGLNRQALDYILEQGAKLVITVDCGIKDSALVNEYVAKGLKFIITDHHTLPENGLDFDKSVPLVHPNLPRSKYPFKEICATNVVWKLVQQIAELYELKNFNAEKYIDLVALATVCDVMPLIQENRIIVSLGLLKLQNSDNFGLRSILEKNKLDLNLLDAYHFGFVLGPRLNAAGRMEDAILGLKLLTSYDVKIVNNIEDRLEILNKERQAITMKYIAEAEIQAVEQIRANNKLLFVKGDDWSEGIIGLVAGKLTEKYYLPTIAVSNTNGVSKGSARSIKGFNITEAISKSSELLTRFGGHSQAAGFSASLDKLERFMIDIQEYAKQTISDDMLENVLHLDALIDSASLNIDFVKQLLNLKPFGYGNQTPTFEIRNVKVIKKSLLGKDAKHFKMRGQLQDGTIIEAIAFNKPEFFAKIADNEFISLAGQLDINIWNGQENLQFGIKDIKLKDEK